MADTIFTNATATTPGTVVQASWLNDANTDTYNTLSAVAGSNTITATGPTTLTAYGTFQQFFFTPTTTNTGAVTININGLGARSITKSGTTPLVAGDLVAGGTVLIAYDGTRFQLLNLQATIANGGTGASTAAQALINLGATGRLIGIRQFTATGTYTPTAGTTSVLVKVLAGGGAGGGAVSTAGSQVSGGAGGGGGGYAEGILTTGFSGATVTVGAGGVAVSGAAGGTGGSSSLGALSATGGTGGTISTAGPATGLGPVAGGAGTGTIAIPGSPSGVSVVASSLSFYVGSAGGGSVFGNGAPAVQSSGSGGAFGTDATVPGGGGSGALNGSSQTSRNGGNGGAGRVIIYEYS